MREAPGAFRVWGRAGERRTWGREAGGAAGSGRSRDEISAMSPWLQARRRKRREGREEGYATPLHGSVRLRERRRRAAGHRIEPKAVAASRRIPHAGSRTKLRAAFRRVQIGGSTSPNRSIAPRAPSRRTWVFKNARHLDENPSLHAAFSGPILPSRQSTW